MSNIYVQPQYEGKQSLLDAIANDDVEALISMIIAAALYEDDFDFVQRACVELSSHADENVRGNAVLGFGHIARLFERLSNEAIDIVRNHLDDPSDYVRGHAYSAASDVSHFLGIEVRTKIYDT